MSDLEVEQLVAERARLRAERSFAKADAIRVRLERAGIELADGAAGPRWRRVGVDPDRIALKYQRLVLAREQLQIKLARQPEQSLAIMRKLEALDIELDILRKQEELATLRARRGVVVAPPAATLGLKSGG